MGTSNARQDDPGRQNSILCRTSARPPWAALARCTRLTPLILLGLATAIAACGVRTITPTVHPIYQSAAPDGKSVLKVHLKSGSMLMLHSWSTSNTTLSGFGVRYTLQRDSTPPGTHEIPLDSVALLETNTPGAAYPFGAQGLAVMTTLWAAVSVVCLADPKGCFGSCPTFYVDGSSDMPVAEGFSSSIARALEARDVDALPDVHASAGKLSIEMRNEAMETHAVRHVRLLAAPATPGGRTYATPDGRFFIAGVTHEPLTCNGAEGDCRQSVRKLDEYERVSAADSFDLAAQEFLELEFPAITGSAGLVLGARHTMLSTFLFYESIAALGPDAGEYVALMERKGTEFAENAMRMSTLVGVLDAEVMDATGEWISIGSFAEAGPIATDVAVLPLPATPGIATTRIRLRLTRGAWRVGYVGLASLSEAVEPTTLEPVAVTRAGRRDTAALQSLLDTNRYLATYPGDNYSIEFDVSGVGEHADLFLDTRGYYYEWLRSEWFAQEDATLAALVLLNPAEALRRLAPAYKKREPYLDRIFWASRFGRDGK